MTKYIEPATGEEVELERWRWEAYYKDGTLLKQFDKIDEETGVFHRFAEIDQSRLKTFRMVNDSGRILTLLFKSETQKLIHKYRSHIQKVIASYPDKPDEVVNEITFRSYFFGYQEGNSTVIFFIGPSDEVILTDNPDKIVTG